jgi:hypothetical protein
MRFAKAIPLVLLLCAAPLLEGKKFPGMQEIDDQVSEIKDLHGVAAKQNCDSWGWAAAVETMLVYRDVPLKQQFWAEKAFSSQCPAETASFEQLAHFIDDDYLFDDQRKLRLENRFLAGASAAPDFLIMSMRQQHPLLLIWKKHPYILYGVQYDEFIKPNANRMFIIQKMSLADPLAMTRDHRFVVFDRSVDDASDIDGIMDIVVLPPMEH